MERKSSSPHSQQPASCPYPEPDQSSPCPLPSFHFLEIHFKVILSPTPGSSKWPLFPQFPQQNPVCTSSLPHTCYKPRPHPSSRFVHPNSTGWRVGIIKLLIKYFFPFAFSLSLSGQIFSSAPYSQKPSAHFPSSMWMIKLHNPTKQQANIQFCKS
jgi:hypothetical protein